MAYFYGYSFVTVAIPLILGLLFLWLGKNCGTEQVKEMRNIDSGIQVIPHFV